MSETKLRIVIVNDSATMRAALRGALAGEADLEVAGEANSGSEGVRVVLALRPDVVLMDVVMPGGDGYAATRAIMAAAPTPIVLVSSVVNPRDVAVAMEALRSGALAIVEGLPSPTDPVYQIRRSALLHLVRSMAGVPVGVRAPSRMPSPRSAPVPEPKPPRGPIAAIGIATSTGGPGALVDLLRVLPRDAFPPILIVQHIARGFADGFAQWLGDTTGHPVVCGVHQTVATRGTVYIAPDDRHIGLGAGLRVLISDAPPVGLFRPSGTHLLQTIARSIGPRGIGVVLTGMGEDGADGAAELRRAGGQVVVQDEATSVVFGMPRAALERGGADAVLPLHEIAAWVRARSGF